MIEFCTGMQENEAELDEFFKKNPGFSHLDPLSEDFDKKFEGMNV